MDNQNSPQSGEVTRLLSALVDGDQSVEDELMAAVYGELRLMARRQMRRERDGHTLQTTALAHEAYIRLVDQRATRWQNRQHFYSIAARVMRRVLVDHARARGAARRGGHMHREDIGDVAILCQERAAEVIALDEALTALTAFDERKSRVVELRFFGGLSIAETAEVLKVSEGTIERDWTLAKAWLQRAMLKGGK